MAGTDKTGAGDDRGGEGDCNGVDGRLDVDRDLERDRDRDRDRETALEIDRRGFAVAFAFAFSGDLAGLGLVDFDFVLCWVARRPVFVERVARVLTAAATASLDDLRRPPLSARGGTDVDRDRDRERDRDRDLDLDGERRVALLRRGGITEYFVVRPTRWVGPVSGTHHVMNQKGKQPCVSRPTMCG
jgi:hypothetical protein